MVRDTPPYGHVPTYQISLTYLERQKCYDLDKFRWEEAEEAEEKNQTKTICLTSFEGET
jgi:tRNA A37 threonylcarbamoyladenosine biosynthesis protein TsaE